MRVQKMIMMLSIALLGFCPGCRKKSKVTVTNIVSPNLIVLSPLHEGDQYVWRGLDSSVPQFRVIFISPSPCAGTPNPVSAPDASGIQVASCTASKQPKGASFPYYIKTGEDRQKLDDNVKPCNGCNMYSGDNSNFVGVLSPQGVTAGRSIAVTAKDDSGTVYVSCDANNNASLSTDPVDVSGGAHIVWWTAYTTTLNWTGTVDRPSPCAETGPFNKDNSACHTSAASTGNYPYTITVPSCTGTKDIHGTIHR